MPICMNCGHRAHPGHSCVYVLAMAENERLAALVATMVPAWQLSMEEKRHGEAKDEVKRLRTLLAKYVSHVEDCEGVNFLRRYIPSGILSEEEGKEIQSIADELSKERGA